MQKGWLTVAVNLEAQPNVVALLLQVEVVCRSIPLNLLAVTLFGKIYVLPLSKG
jgi:hypothetical protein